MDRQVKKFFKKLGRMSLETDERRALRSGLLAYTQKHPMPVSEKRLWPGLLSRKFAPAMLVVLSAVTLGGGISFAAEQTVPGNFLYPIKIYVNEEVRAAIAPTTSAKASWEVQRLERRLEEAEWLIAREKFDNSTNSELKKNLARHSLAINQKLAILTLTNDLAAATAVSSDLDATIYAHTKLLPRLAARPDIASDVQELVAGFTPDEIDDDEVDDADATGAVPAAPQPSAPAALETETKAEVKAEIKKERKDDGSKRTQAQKGKGASKKRIDEIDDGPAAPQPSAPAALETETKAEVKAEIKKERKDDGSKRTQAQKRKEAAEKGIKEINKIFARARNLDAGSQTRLQSQFAAATQLFAEGEAKMEQERYAEASALFQEARRSAEEVKVLINARERFGASVNLDNGATREETRGKNKPAPQEENKSGSTEDDGDDRRGPSAQPPAQNESRSGSNKD